MRHHRFASLLASFALLLAMTSVPSSATAYAPPRETANLTSTPTPQPVPTLTVAAAPKVSGTFRYNKTLKRTVGTYSPKSGLKYKTQWLRNGKDVPKATKSTYKLGVKDVGARISVRVTVSKKGYQSRSAQSKTTPKIKHVRDGRKTVKYRISTRGKTTTSKASFSKEVNKILNDPRGWRADGIVFKEVKSGGSMTIFLAEARTVTSFSSQCSTYWSCRVGPNVIINQDRWKKSTPAWKKAKGTTLTGYRHMVVNHEVGHWLGWSHRTCSGKGKKAPLMMQQSKGFNGCKPNPWPTKSERNPPRFR